MRLKFVAAVTVVFILPLGLQRGLCRARAQDSPSIVDESKRALFVPQRLLPLLHAPEIQNQLALSPEQTKKLESLFLTTDGPWWRARNLPPAEQHEAVAKQESWLRERLKTLLSGEQTKRLNELELQAQGSRVFLRDDLARTIQLSGEQMQKLFAIYSATEKASADYLASVRTGKPDAELKKSAEQKQAAESQKVFQVLTSQQQQLLGTQLGAALDLSQLKRIYPLAPELDGVTNWHNSTGEKLADLRGKVVAVHFYAFACSNCQANIPVYNQLHSEFKDEDFAIIGIQTPELSREKDFAQVASNAKAAEIDYPIAMDANATNWKNWGTTMWPTIYIIDKNGYIRWWWSGELKWQGATGDQLAMEVIRQLLKE